VSGARGPGRLLPGLTGVQLVGAALSRGRRRDCGGRGGGGRAAVGGGVAAGRRCSSRLRRLSPARPPVPARACRYHGRALLVSFDSDGTGGSAQVDALTREIQLSFKRLDGEVRGMDRQGGQEDASVRLQVRGAERGGAAAARAARLGSARGSGPCRHPPGGRSPGAAAAPPAS
jgi:hypothetical protein